MGTAYNVCSMEDIAISWLLCWQWKYTAQNVNYLYFKTELWHLYKSLLPSAKGLSIYFYIESSSFLLKSTRCRAHCRLHSLLLVYIGYDLTGSLLPWITMSSQSLIFKGALHLCFAVSERASEIPFCYIMLWLFWESVVIRVLLLWLASWLCYWYEQLRDLSIIASMVSS